MGFTSSFYWLFMLAVLVAYLIPSVIAFARKARRAPVIAAVNLFTGWTGLGWLGSLAWACVDKPREAPSGSQDSEAQPMAGYKFPYENKQG